MLKFELYNLFIFDIVTNHLINIDNFVAIQKKSEHIIKNKYSYFRYIISK